MYQGAHLEVIMCQQHILHWEISLGQEVLHLREAAPHRDITLYLAAPLHRVITWDPELAHRGTILNLAPAHIK